MAQCMACQVTKWESNEVRVQGRDCHNKIAIQSVIILLPPNATCLIQPLGTLAKKTYKLAT
jgi:hypothetical protein